MEITLVDYTLEPNMCFIPFPPPPPSLGSSQTKSKPLVRAST